MACLNAAASISLATSSVLLTVSMSRSFSKTGTAASATRQVWQHRSPRRSPRQGRSDATLLLSVSCLISPCWGLRDRHSRLLIGRRKETNFALAALQNVVEPVKWQDNRLFGLRGGHPGWGAPGLLARAIPARFSKTVVAKMAAEKGATSCLLSALGVLFPDYPKIGQ